MGKHVRLAHLLDDIYFRFFQHMFMVTLYLSIRKDDTERDRLLSTLALTYVLGALAYQLLPSLGPVFYDPAAYGYTISSGFRSRSVQEFLINNTRHVSTTRDGNLEIFGYVAAVPSLHVAQDLLCVYAVRRYPLALYPSIAFLLLTVMATIGLGWHYWMDSILAIPLVMAARALSNLAPGGSLTPAFLDSSTRRHTNV
jgi:hypothetical protein